MGHLSIGLIGLAGQQKYISKEGILEKRKDGMFGGWNSRLVNVKNKTLKFYDERKEERKGVLNFDLYQCAVSVNDWNKP